ncbi:uncharacterized protein LOC132258781 isoform X2 [Phlebotomus argentipes]|uniref:uncharacterized protein LOC132258781 isoform X2 n=1 Tax=Phlebotomus argentipes TaxID=94469 RepID=UPI0028931810|nr:uncharacterized protein LOC132258781 isoform X2 [Phlebotomus argentipes]
MSSATAMSWSKWNGEENSLIKLRLNKPQTWNWQLTTSRSSPNIAFPRIQLFDQNGQLLADASEADCVLGSKVPSRRPSSARTKLPEAIAESKLEDSPSDTQSYNNLVHCDSLKISHVRSKSLHEGRTRHRSKHEDEEPEKFLSSLVSQLKRDGINYKIRRRNSYDVNTKLMCEDGYDERQEKCGKSISCSDLEKSEAVANCCVADGGGERMNYAIVKSKSAVTMQLDGGASESREKRRYRRTNSVNSLRFSKSILERISEFKRRSSSTDSQEFNEDAEEDDENSERDKPKYFLRTSKAGTLLVCEESFRHRRVRRRGRSSSSRELGCGGESTMPEPKRYSQEKVTHTFEYVGVNEGTKVSPGPEMNSKSRYEREIANIDGLIEKVVAKERAEMEICPPEQGYPINGCENQRAEEQSDYRRIRSCSRQKSAKDDKLKHGIRHRQHRSVSADRANYRSVYQSPEALSSSDESSDRDELHRRSRRSRRKHTKDDVSSSRSGDQLVALNKVSLAGSDPNPPNLINESSDQVFLRLVRRLATLQPPQRLSNSASQLYNAGEIEASSGENRISDSGEVCAKFPRELNNNSCEESAHNDGVEGIRAKGSWQDFSGGGNNISAVQLINCASTIGEGSEKDKVDSESTCYSESQELEDLRTMGSNASRHSGKGLSGRRSQSSGNLCNGKHQANGTHYRRNGRKVNLRSDAEPQDSKAATAANQRCDEDCSRINSTSALRSEVHARIGDDAGNSGEIGKLIGVSISDRNKFCGSLPNHLDVDDIEPDPKFSNVQNQYVTSAGVLKYTLENNGTMDQAEYVTVAPRKQPFQQTSQADQQFPAKQSSPYNSSSGKGSITSSSNLGGSTFKANVDNKLELHLKMPTNRVNFDPSCDQGYGSERSPEDEMPPPFISEEDHCALPAMSCQLTYWCEPGEFRYSNLGYAFITKDCTFSVEITKGPRGLGLSISGGAESSAVFPGLIRIKRLFPHQAAWATGMLQPGDILLEANGTPLTGLTNYEALEVLRTTPNNILLIVCRPSDEQYRKLSPPSEPPKPPQRTNLHPGTSQPFCEPLSPLQTNFNGVNDVPLSHMTHEEAVIFLRQAAETVKLRLYRDVAQTPVAALSPTNPENKDISNSLKTKVYLRPEAINLLSDLAHRKQTPCGGDSSGSSMKSSTTSPRRLRRCAKSSLSGSQTQSDCGSAHYVVCSQATSSSVYSDSESTLSQSFANARCAQGCCSDTYTIREGDSESEADVEGLDERQVANRPNFLNLGAASQSGCTPVVSRKPMFQFTVPSNAYELNNLDNELLDAPIYQSGGHPAGDASQDFTSLPCETFLVACKTESDLRDIVEANFNHRNPIYQSAQVQMNREETATSSAENTDDGIKQDGTKSLLKWKGVMFSPEGGLEQKEVPEASTESDSMVASNPTDRENLLRGLNTDGYKMITVELHRGWNSRLGFSLQTDIETKRAAISAIYSDSVAAKDGRLKVGDQIVMVNDELVTSMPTSEIIDLLRIIRGSICIVILRKQ